MLSLEDMAALTAAEGKHLGVNSPEFTRRHNEIMAMADDMQSRYKKMLLPVPQILIGASNPETIVNRVWGDYNISPARSKERI